jgi:hypothetical protein
MGPLIVFVSSSYYSLFIFYIYPLMDYSLLSYLFWIFRCKGTLFISLVLELSLSDPSFGQTLGLWPRKERKKHTHTHTHIYILQEYIREDSTPF